MQQQAVFKFTYRISMLLYRPMTSYNVSKTKHLKEWTKVDYERRRKIIIKECESQKFVSK